MFATMMDGIKEEAVGFLFNLDVEVEQHEDHTHLTISGMPDQADGAELELIDAGAAEAAGEAEEEPEGMVAPQFRAKGLERPMAPQQLSYSAPSEVGEAEVVTPGPGSNTVDPYAGVGRNEPCPCGSGKKFKQCHGAVDRR
jgi:preprotein translocase subunit SecA